VPTYLAFLRAINLGAVRKFPKEDIRRAVEAAGCTGVETYINTGNVRLVTPARSQRRVEAALEVAFLADRGFEVPTAVFRREEFAELAAESAALAAARPAAGRHSVELLRAAPPADVAEQIEATSGAGVEVVVRGRAVHVFAAADAPLGGPSPRAPATPLGVSTNRNARVVQAVAERWC
jgi:uncharacterized protein (DUF1697 family)